MIKSIITNEMLNDILLIESNKNELSSIRIPLTMLNKLRKNSKKKTSYSTNKIEGNPLTEEEAYKAIDDPHNHKLSFEQEMKNVYFTLTLLENELANHKPISLSLILNTQKSIMKGSSKEKIGLRGEMPPGVFFAVYDAKSGQADYIPPEAKDINGLLEELLQYLKISDDHPLIKAAILHYEIVTIHPFEDGNGRTARLLSSYLLDYYGYGFNRIGSLDEYFLYNLDEYYSSLQMSLPPLYYEGRNNPPHPEIWLTYFLKMMILYSNKVKEISFSSISNQLSSSFKELNLKEKSFLKHLLINKINTFKPKELALEMKVTNKTIINWSFALVKCGFLLPHIVNKRITYYSLSDFVLQNKKVLIKLVISEK